MLNLLFPIRCLGCRKTGQYLCPNCLKTLDVRTPICPVCTKPAISGLTHPYCRGRYKPDGLISLFRYGGLMQQIIKKFKFRLITDLSRELTSLIHTQLSQHPTVINLWQNQQYLLTPLPLHPQRERWRGFNQSAIIGRLLAPKLKLEFSDKLITRIRATASQSEMKIALTPKEAQKIINLDPFAQFQKRQQLLKKKRLEIRKQNIAGAFQATQKLDHKNLVVIDDVWTTGATMNECVKALKKASARSVWALTLAR